MTLSDSTLSHYISKIVHDVGIYNSVIDFPIDIGRDPVLHSRPMY